MTPKAVRRELWRRMSRGLINCDFLLHADQKTVASLMRRSASTEFYLNISRQYGKSLLLLALLVEDAWKNPHALYVWFSPFRDDAVDIVNQKAKILFADCPEELRPKLNKQTLQWKFTNGAEIHLYGANNDRARFARGRTVRKSVIDECADVDDLDTLVDDILKPAMLHSTDGRLWMASTPSKIPGHASYTRVRSCLLNGNAVTRTIHDNPLLTQDQVDRHCADAGGVDSATWRREYLAELDVVDPDAVLCPEFSKVKDEVTRPWERPDYHSQLKTLVSIDRGGDTDKADGTGLTFWTYDFPNQTAHVEAAHLLRSPSTGEIIDLVKHEERRLWNGMAPPVRIGDGILAKDFAAEGLVIGKPNKDDRDSAVALLRTTVGQKRLHIDPSAEVAIVQLLHAHTRGGKLARTKEGKHFDVFDSVLYGNRYCYEVLRHINPIAPNVSAFRRAAAPQLYANQDSSALLRRAFAGKGRYG